jgi:hypothetical protein
MAKSSKGKSKGKETSMSKLEVIKNKIANSAGSYGETFYVGDGKKKRVRFLTDFEDAVSVVMHDKWQVLKPTICLKYFDKFCKNCEKDDIRSRENFVWAVYDYDEEKVLLLMFPATKSSPVPDMITAYETYGTLLDRDYMVIRKGGGKDTAYTVMPLDKTKFKKKSAKALSEDEIYHKLLTMSGIDLDEIDDADDVDDEDEDEEEEDGEEEEEEEEEEKHKSKKGNKKSKSKKKKQEEEDEDDEEEEEDDYEDMSLKELQKLCKKRGIKVKKSDDEDDLIEKLEDYDEDDE